jgi:hypothetical protein
MEGQGLSWQNGKQLDEGDLVQQCQVSFSVGFVELNNAT